MITLHHRPGLVVGATLVVIASVVWLLVGPWGDGKPVARGGETAAEDSAAGPAAQVRVQRLAIDDLLEAAPQCTLVVRVRYGDGTLGRGVVVMLHDPGGDTRVGIHRRTTDDAGMCTFRGLPPGRWLARVTAAYATRQAVTTIAPNETARLELVIPVLIHITGRVVDPNSQPVSDAEVLLGPLASRGHDLGVVARSDHDGNFAARSGVDPSIIGARASGYGPSRLVMVTGEGGYFRDGIELVLQREGGDIRGRVTTLLGEGVVAATVRVGAGRLDAIHPVDAGAPPAPAQAWTGDDGRFALAGLSAGEQPIFVRAPGWAPWQGTCRVRAGETVSYDVVLGHGGQIEGRVTTAAGAAIAGCTVTIGLPGNLDFTECFTDDAGQYRMPSVSPGRVAVTARHARHGSKHAEVEVTDGDTKTCDFILEAGRVLAGRVLDEEGRPVSRVAARVTRHGGGWGMGGLTIDADGRFWVPDLPEGQFIVYFQGRSIINKTFRRIDPDGEEIVFPVERKPPRTASVFGIVVDEGGTPIAGTKVTLLVEESLGHMNLGDLTHTEGRTGSFRLGPLPPDTYTAHIEAPGYARAVVRDIELLDYDEYDLGTIKVQRGGHIRLDGIGERPKNSSVHVYLKVHREWVGSIRGDVSMPLRAGTYRVRVHGEGVAEDTREVIVEEGEVTAMPVQWQAGRPVRLETLHSARDVDVWVEVAFTAENRRRLLRRIVLHAGETRIRDDRWLLPGAYEASVRCGDRTWTTPVQVQAYGDELQVVDLVCDG